MTAKTDVAALVKKAFPPTLKVAIPCPDKLAGCCVAHYHLEYTTEQLAAIDALESMQRELDESNELHRMQMAGICVAAMTNGGDLSGRIGKDNPYWTPVYHDVCDAVDREIKERQRAETAEAALQRVEERLQLQHDDILNINEERSGLQRELQRYLDAERKLPDTQAIIDAWSLPGAKMGPSTDDYDALANHALKLRTLATAAIAERDDERQRRERILKWLDGNTTFYNVDADYPVEGNNIPTLAQVSNRIWYHATDDETTYPFSALVERAALRSDGGEEV